jgi:hypothetical protein
MAGIPALFAALGGVGLFYLGHDDHVLRAVVVGGAVFAVGAVLLLVGLARLRRHPVSGVWLIAGWIIGLLAIGAGIGAVLIVVGIEVADALTTSKSPKSEADSVAGFVTGAVGTFAATLFTKDLEEGTGRIWPSAITKKALGEKFEGVFANKSDDKSKAAREAVYADHPHDVDIKGWGLSARVTRAKAIADAL